MTKLSKGKLERLDALSTEAGIIAALAMDQRGSLQKAIAVAQGVETASIAAEQIAEFKTAVSRILSPHASAILLDPVFGLEAARARDASTGLLLAYEKTGYDNTRPGRLPELLDGVSVRRLAAEGADAVKILLYYTPFEAAEFNDMKHAFIERVGAECETEELPFFLELVTYDHAGGGVQELEYAKRKPEIVRGGLIEFSKPQYRVDVFKAEVPVNLRYVDGSRVYEGTPAYSREQALAEFRETGAVANSPVIYLSAGVGNDEFVEALEMASEAESGFCGVLCGRATWKGGIAAYGNGGVQALEDWLAVEGVRNISAVNEALGGASSWKV
jgi:tagatose 1,6-diphosphate aldolase